MLYPMKALCLKKYGAFEFLTIMDIPTRDPKDDEVRVDVRASALNPADYKVALGEFKFLHGMNFPMTLGYDFSGVVAAVGKNAGPYNVGDEVFGFLSYSPFNQQGAFATSLVAKANQIALKPKNVTHIQAAASATSALTAMQSLRDLGRLSSGGRVLITGVSGGVGSVAISVAKKLGAKEVVAVGSDKGLILAKQLGADHVIDRKQERVFDVSKGPFDVVFDAAAAYRWSQWQSKLKPQGAFVTTLPSAAFAVDKLKTLISNTRTEFVNVKSKSDDLRLLAGWLEAGLKIPIETSVGLQDVGLHLQRLKRGEVVGKVAVVIE